MADNVAVTAGAGTTIAADEVIDATLGTVKAQYVKIMDGTLDGTSKAAVGANGLAVDVKAAVITSGTITTVTTVSAVTAITNALPAGTNAIGKLAANSGVDIGDVDITSTVQPAGVSAVGVDRQTVTTAGIAVQVQAHPCKMAIFTAETDNTGNIFVGDSLVIAAAGAEKGFVLYPGQTSIPIPVSNTNLLYINSTVSTDGVAYAYFN